jgi:tetratricopeptide (TPR) repeat protein
MAITLMAAPMANAQKVNKAAIVAKLDKADADSKDAKKSGKAATWLTRGNAYFEAVSAPVSALFVGMEEAMLALTIGKPEAQNANVELNGKVCTEHVYPWVKIYTADGKVATWIVTQTVKEGDLAGEAVASFKKAYELDAKLASKVADGLSKVENYYSTMGNVCLDAGLAAQAAQYYMAAYTTQNTPGYGGQVKNDYLYYAGYLYVVDGATNPDSYAKGAEVLNKALEAGYADADGFIYYYLFHAYYGQKDSSVRVANLQRAKTILMEGLAKYPANTLIVEGLIGLYTDRENPVGDPQELVSMVDGALERDPQNKSLWNSRAIMFDRLKNYEESIKSFQKVVELDPKNVQAIYNLGLSYVFKGDAMNDEMNSRDYRSNADFQADQKKVIEAYKPAVPVLESAYEIDPKNATVVETLKNLTFRLRDEEGMMAKYEKYNKALNELKAQ